MAVLDQIRAVTRSIENERDRMLQADARHDDAGGELTEADHRAPMITSETDQESSRTPGRARRRKPRFRRRQLTGISEACRSNHGTVPNRHSLDDVGFTHEGCR